jgi:precorrin-3B C17-methyltransferase
VGIGPGGLEHLTPAARMAICEADVVVGYQLYLDFLGDLVRGKELLSSGMRAERERAEAAIVKARAGKRVAIISTGDAGIYGMAGLVLEILGGDTSLPVEVVPGITAASAAAACLGAPLMNDFAVISLSDLMTPLPTIQARIAAVAAADMVLCLYNPRSNVRVDPLDLALKELRRVRSSTTPVGVVKHALRSGQQVFVTTLAELDPACVDMMTILVIGNSSTELLGGRMVTRRGYLKENL